jgi:cytochrome P450
MAATSTPPFGRPENLPPALSRDFDIFRVAGPEADPHLALLTAQRAAPEIFWTPRNGGHWVAIGAEAIEAILLDPQRFSSECIFVPQKPPDAQRELPIECDPPRHSVIRKPLVMGLLPAMIDRRAPAIRELAAELIDGFSDRGECEFVSEFAQVFPICVFLDLVQLPRSDRHFLVPIAKKVIGGRTPAIRQEGIDALVAYILPVVRSRREHPGEDLLSPLVNLMESGGKITENDALAYVNTVLFAGLDTVAAMLSHVTRFLALHPAQRHELADRLGDSAFMHNAIQELLRRHGIAAIGRVVSADMTYRGVSLRKGESIMLLTAMVGLDEHKHQKAAEVEFARQRSQNHAAFGRGIHSCPGHALARRELAIFLEAWLSRIPDFAIAPGSTPAFSTGFVTSIAELNLVWPRPRATRRGGSLLSEELRERGS